VVNQPLTEPLASVIWVYRDLFDVCLVVNDIDKYVGHRDVVRVSPDPGPAVASRITS